MFARGWKVDGRSLILQRQHCGQGMTIRTPPRWTRVGSSAAIGGRDNTAGSGLLLVDVVASRPEDVDSSSLNGTAYVALADPTTTFLFLLVRDSWLFGEVVDHARYCEIEPAGEASQYACFPIREHDMLARRYGRHIKNDSTKQVHIEQFAIEMKATRIEKKASRGHAHAAPEGLRPGGMRARHPCFPW